jgi:cell division septal protein FtsQ
VRVHLPNRVIIDVAEFLPLVEWQKPDGRRWLAEDGSAVPVTGDAPGLILVDPQGEAADADGKMQPNILKNLAIIRQALPDQRDFYYGASEGIYFRAPEGWNVYLGEEGKMERKLSILAGMQSRLVSQEPKPKKVDLRFEEFPTLE